MGGMVVILGSADIRDEGLATVLTCRSKLRPEQHFNPSLMQKVVIFFPLGLGCFSLRITVF